MSLINTPELVQLHHEIGQGMDMQQWLLSPMGRYVLGRVALERTSALECLATADPENPKAIRDEQMRVQMADSFEAWLLEVVEGGLQAERAFQESSG